MAVWFKKASAVLAVLVMLLGLTACGDGSFTELVPQTEDSDIVEEDETEDDADIVEEDVTETLIAQRDETRGHFLNTKNLPEMDPYGVRGMVKEAYFTTSGDLAVTINLSNGTDSEHEIVRVAATIINDQTENNVVARQTFENGNFLTDFKVPAHGRSEMYIVIDEENVLLPEDTLRALGSTFEIGSQPTETQPQGAIVGDGPKDIAAGRPYFENLGILPEFSADGVKASIIRARYTNDGSLVLDFSVSNGTDKAQTVSSLDVMIQNGAGETIVDCVLADATMVFAKSYGEVQLIVDTSNVLIKDDPLDILTTSIKVTTA